MRVLSLTFATFAIIASALPCAAATKAPSKPKNADAKITSPDVAAKRLYDAWKRHDRAAANAVATQEAVEKLFSTNFRPMKALPCEHADEGFQCVYHDAVEELFDVAFNVDGGASAGYNVVSVSFSSED